MTRHINGLEVTGILAHGNTITITDIYSRLGIRENVKPKYVNLGDSKLGSVLGRDQNNYFHTDTIIDPSIKSGQLSSSIKRNNKGTINATKSLFGECPVDENKPILHYCERFYNFDAASDSCWSDTVVFTPAISPLECYRIVINGIECSYMSSAAPTALEINNGLAASINANFGGIIKAGVNGSKTNSVNFASESTIMNFSSSSNLTGGYFNNSINLKRNRLFRNFGSSYANAYISGDGVGSFISTEYTPSQNNYDFCGPIGEETTHLKSFEWVRERYYYVRGTVNKFDAQWRKYVGTAWQNTRHYLQVERSDMFVANPLTPNTVYTITMLGTSYNFTTDANPTGDEFVSGFAKLINADSLCPVTCSLGYSAANQTLYKNANNWLWFTTKNGKEYPEITHSTNIRRMDYRLGFNQLRLDQISNRCGRGVEKVDIHVGYQHLDDEYCIVYAGDASTLSACTDLIPMPQVEWSKDSASFFFVESGILPTKAYFYVQNGFDPILGPKYVSYSGVRP
jgi:hypothetical protein